MDTFAESIQLVREPGFLYDTLKGAAEIFADVDDEPLLAMFTFLLKTCKDFNNEVACRDLVQYFMESSGPVFVGDDELEKMDGDTPSLLLKYFMHRTLFRPELGKYIAMCNPNLTFLELGLEMLRTDSNELIGLFIDNLAESFNADFQSLAQLLQAAQEDNLKGAEYLAYKLKEVSDFAPVPPHVIVTEGEDDSLIAQSFKEHASGIMVASLESLGVLDFHDEKKRDVIKSMPSQSKAKALALVERNEHEQRTKAMQVYMDLPDSIPQGMSGLGFNEMFTEIINDNPLTWRDVDKLLGPVNPRPKDVGCRLFGGCRMLTCDCYAFTDTMDEDDSERESKDWFMMSSSESDEVTHGNCDMSFQKIELRSLAVRIPILNGGWRGCFSSWENAKRFLESELRITTQEVQGISEIAEDMVFDNGVHGMELTQLPLLRIEEQDMINAEKEMFAKSIEDLYADVEEGRSTGVIGERLDLSKISKDSLQWRVLQMALFMYFAKSTQVILSDV